MSISTSWPWSIRTQKKKQWTLQYWIVNLDILPQINKPLTSCIKVSQFLAKFLRKYPSFSLTIVTNNIHRPILILIKKLEYHTFPFPLQNLVIYFLFSVISYMYRKGRKARTFGKQAKDKKLVVGSLDTLPYSAFWGLYVMMKKKMFSGFDILWALSLPFLNQQVSFSFTFFNPMIMILIPFCLFFV